MGIGLRILLSIVVVLGGVAGAGPRPASAAPNEPGCFAEAGLCIAGRFLEYWLANGGLARNGLPLTGERRELLEDGKEYLVQYFERVRLEYHPENAPPYDVLLGQFGRRIQEAQPDWGPVPGKTYFPATGHNVGPRFLAYWEANGGLAQFGLPIAEETYGDRVAGQLSSVQYFERARFEYHPENAGTPYEVLLGQFGRTILEQNALLAGNRDFATLYLTNAPVRERLGLAQGAATTAPGAAQEFERGQMLWRGDRRLIHVLYPVNAGGGVVQINRGLGGSGGNIAYPDTWVEGDDPGGGPAPVPGLFYPQRGFGKVWRENEGLREGLGYATTANEFGFTIAVQEFAGGLLIGTDTPEGRFVYAVYILRSPNGRATAAGYQRFPAPAR